MSPNHSYNHVPGVVLAAMAPVVVTLAKGVVVAFGIAVAVVVAAWNAVADALVVVVKISYRKPILQQSVFFSRCCLSKLSNNKIS